MKITFYIKDKYDYNAFSYLENTHIIKPKKNILENLRTICFLQRSIEQCLTILQQLIIHKINMAQNAFYQISLTDEPINSQYILNRN